MALSAVLLFFGVFFSYFRGGCVEAFLAGLRGRSSNWVHWYNMTAAACYRRYPGWHSYVAAFKGGVRRTDTLGALV